MIIIKDIQLRKILCDHYNCSDQNGKQFPECTLWNEKNRQCQTIDAWILFDKLKAISNTVYEEINLMDIVENVMGGEYIIQISDDDGESWYDSKIKCNSLNEVVCGFPAMMMGGDYRFIYRKKGERGGK